jgi:hypothetical protein
MAPALARRAYDLALAVAILFVLGCTAFVLRRDRAAPFVHGNPSSHTAAVFLQERDCTTNLALLQLLSRAEFSDALSVVVYDVGGRRSAGRVTNRLNAMDLPFPVLPAPRSSLSQLRRMGYDATPVLVLLGPDARVRMAAAAPANLVELQRLASALHVLTDSPAPVRKT